MAFLLECMPIIWLVLAVVLGVIEASTVTLVAIWFAIGSVAAIIPALLGGPLWLQMATFLAVSTITLALTRPVLANKLLTKKTRTNADSIVGQIGVVTEPIDNVESRGRVLISGLEWTARSEDGERIAEKEQVLIKAISGVKVIVERIV